MVPRLGHMRGNMGGKLFAVLVIVIALLSAVPIVTHTFLGATVTPPEDISTHGAEIDKQLRDGVNGDIGKAAGSPKAIALD